MQAVSIVHNIDLFFRMNANPVKKESDVSNAEFERLFIFEKRKTTVGGGSPDTNTYLRAKVKVSVSENGQFSGHLIFYKKHFCGEKKVFTPINKNFVFLKKKMFLFLKKNVFFEMFFRKN